MKEDLAHKRPWLLVSLVFGLSYPLAAMWHVPEIFAVIWKMASVGALVPYALRRHHNGEFAMLAGVLGLCALADGVLEFSLTAGGAIFAAAHLLAIALYARHRRVKPVVSQQALGVVVAILTPIIAYLLAGAITAIYAVSLSIMAGMAWMSNFPRYRVGIGAMMFVASDLLVFWREGQGGQFPAMAWVIWLLYYLGMVLIATGIVQTLVKRGHFDDA
ncbi:lysoplasmalogenase family protein [Sphingorhabdus arenilitoris]|uniref:Lysoplasmalogenase family protein n=1 Tax=Sphingorhabdus arenilitoris TaxID=1490041 RepID=A0ABV8RGI1_9SPHN